MRYKTLFRVLLKVIGVWLVIEGLARITGTVFQIVAFLDRGMTFSFFAWGISGIIELVAGLYLFFGGRWIADKAIPGNRPYCHECGYDLSSSSADKCPECGQASHSRVDS